MSAEATLKRLCERSETRKLARSLAQTASVLTRPGSGHNISTNIIIPICAYLASEELGNGEVSQKTAQANACVKPVDFANALATIKRVLAEAAANARSTRSVVSLSYETLLLPYTKIKPPNTQQVVKWMELTERELVNKDGNRKRDLVSMKCAVFAWASKISKLGCGTLDFSPEKYKVDMAVYNRLLDFMEDNLVDQRAYLVDANDFRKKAVPNTPSKPKGSRSVTATPSRLQGTPSKSSLKTPGSQSSAAATPSRSSTKRSVVWEEDEENDTLPQTPTRPKAKRQKIEANSSPNKTPQPTRSTPRVAAAATSSNAMYDEDALPELVVGPPRHKPMTPAAPETPRRKKSSGRGNRILEEDAMDVDEPADVAEPEEEEEDISGPRHFRPIFQEHKQWTSRDPRIERKWNSCREHVQSLVELYGDPFESYRPAMQV